MPEEDAKTETEMVDAKKINDSETQKLAKSTINESALSIVQKKLPSLPTGDPVKDKEVEALQTLVKQEEGHFIWKK